ncbi:MAG: glycosyltransferase [Chloroflexi bacterium]|nr:glycosyltransferase [Chloroflexota bacterium]
MTRSIQDKRKTLVVLRASVGNLNMGVRPYNLHRALERLGCRLEYIDGLRLGRPRPGPMLKLARLLVTQRSRIGAFMLAHAFAAPVVRLLKATGVPVILDVRDDPNLQDEAYGLPVEPDLWRRRRALLLKNFRLVDRVTVTSETYRRMYPSEFQERMVLILNASDPEHFRCSELPQQRRVGVLSGLSPGRNLELLLEAALTLKTDFPDLEVAIGYQPYRDCADYCRDLVKKYSCSWISFTTEIDYGKAPDFYSSCYATVISHRKHEYFDAITPVKLFDSMASGRPVVSTDCSETAKILQEEQCGLVCDFTIEDMVSKLRLLLRDRDMASRLGQNGRRAVEERHNWLGRAQSILLGTGLLERLLRVGT